MTAMIILGLSVVLQIAAVVLALRLIPLTGRRGPWALISAGMLLIVIRRTLHIVQVVSEGNQPSASEATEAMMNLALSMLFLIGVYRIRSVFESHFKVQAQLRASEERFRLAFENARDAIFWADADTGHLVNCNRAAEALVGRPRAEILGQPQTFLHPVEDVDRQREVFRAFTQEWAKGLVELEVLRKDGRRVPVEISGAITEIAGQRIAQGIFMDITGRKRAEHALVASERKYRLLHESMTDAFVLVGMDGRIREFNRAYMDMLGYKVQEIYQLNYVDITPAKWHDFEAEIVRSQILPRGHSEVYCKEYRRKDGSVFPVELRTFLLRDGAGQPAGMWAIVRDVTEREAAVAAIRQGREELEVRVQERTAELSQTVAALRESEQRYRQLFDTVPDAVIAFDAQTGRVVDWNQAAQGMFGYTPEEFRALTVFDISAEPEKTGVTFPRTMNGEITRIPLRYCRRKDGARIPVEIAMGKFVVAGRQVVCGVHRDITERLQAQAHLAESRDRLRSVLASMDDLLFVYDKEGRFIDYYCQPDELGRLYAPPEQFLGKHYRDVLPANVSGLIDGAIEALRETGKVQQIEYAIEVAGQRRWFNAKVSLWKDARGEVGGMTVVVRDVTEHVLAEQELRDSEARYRGLFEQSPVAMWEMDFSPLRPYVAGLRARGVGDLRKHFRDNPCEVNDLLAAGRVLAINEATVRMEGVATKAEVLDHTGPDAPETRAHMVESRIALAEGQTAVQIQQRGYTASGRTMEGILDYLVLPGHEQTLDRVLVAITDVTTIKEAQEKLEEMARFPMENTEVELRLGSDGTVLFANPPGEALLAEWGSGLGRQGPKECRNWIPEALSSGQPSVHELQHGGRIWTFRVVPIVGRGYVNVYGSDITARKRMEERLQSSEAMYRALVETTHTGYLILDSHGCVVDANAEYVRLTGHARLEEILGRSVGEWTAPHDRERNAAEVARCVEQGFVRDLRIDYVDRQGKVTPVEIQATVVPNGDSFQILSICRDIAARVERQDAMRASEARFRRLFEQSPVSLWEMDLSQIRRQIEALRASGVGDIREYFRQHPEAVEPVLAGGKILAVNEATLQLQGVSSLEELLSRKLGPLAEETHPAMLEARTLLAEGRTRCRVESKASAADGRKLEVILNYMILPGHEQTWERAMVAVTDITAVREAQVALQGAHRRLMTAAEDERRRLARELHDSVAQDLVALELSLRNTGSGLSRQPEQSEAGKALEAAVGRCNQAVRDIRGICHGLYPPALEVFGLVPSLEQLARHCTDAGLPSRLRVADEVKDRRFGADVEIAVFRTAQEAVNNALRHSKAKSLSLALEMKDGRLTLTVKDNGQGFDSEGKTPGLGLVSMRERAEAVAGELRIDSHKAGTTVSLRVPVEPARTPTP